MLSLQGLPVVHMTPFICETEISIMQNGMWLPTVDYMVMQYYYNAFHNIFIVKTIIFYVKKLLMTIQYNLAINNNISHFS